MPRNLPMNENQKARRAEKRRNGYHKERDAMERLKIAVFGPYGRYNTIKETLDAAIEHIGMLQRLLEEENQAPIDVAPVVQDHPPGVQDPEPQDDKNYEKENEEQDQDRMEPDEFIFDESQIELNPSEINSDIFQESIDYERYLSFDEFREDVSLESCPLEEFVWQTPLQFARNCLTSNLNALRDGIVPGYM